MPRYDQVESCDTCGAKFFQHEINAAKVRVFRMCPECQRETCPHCRTMEPWALEYHAACAPAKPSRKSKPNANN